MASPMNLPAEGAGLSRPRLLAHSVPPSAPPLSLPLSRTHARTHARPHARTHARTLARTHAHCALPTRGATQGPNGSASSVCRVARCVGGQRPLATPRGRHGRRRTIICVRTQAVRRRLTTCRRAERRHPNSALAWAAERSPCSWSNLRIPSSAPCGAALGPAPGHGPVRRPHAARGLAGAVSWAGLPSVASAS